MIKVIYITKFLKKEKTKRFNTCSEAFLFALKRCGIVVV